MTQNDDTQDRFLAAIAERLTPETIAEAHVFPPIRQGGVESGVAVIAVHHGAVASSEEAGGDGLPTIGEPGAEDSRRAYLDGARAPADDAEARLTVYTAKYRLAIKGPDRGKWEFALEAEADAPLLTIDKVVRGVQQRSGEAGDALRISGDEFAGIISARGAQESGP